MNDLTQQTLTFVIEDAELDRLARVCGPLEANIDYVSRRLGVNIGRRGAQFQVEGAADSVQMAMKLIEALYASADNDISQESIHLHLQSLGGSAGEFLSMPDEHSTDPTSPDDFVLSTRRLQVRPRGENQLQYVRNIQQCNLAFGVGPAGTGKTFLAVASAVHALENELVERLILVRPAVEAGERLGFLPGDLAQKVDPYLRPIFDALYQMMGFERVTRLIEKSIIEVAPLAYMRGRTLNNAFVILDEAQNTTRLQMKMFLTRLGFGSTAVVTGDITQTDLPQRETSGLTDAIRLLSDINGIRFTFFSRNDVVRHPLVSRIIEAYEEDHVSH